MSITLPKHVEKNPYICLYHKTNLTISKIYIIYTFLIPSLTDHAEKRVKIVLQDVNDEYPVFINTPRPFLATVSANAAPGTSVYELTARDADRFSDVQYNLESGK